VTASAVALLLLLWFAVAVLTWGVLTVADQHERQEVADRVWEKLVEAHPELETLYLEERDAP